MGISTNSKYDLKKTVYISDMTKPIRQSKLLVGRLPKNSHEIVLTKSTAIHLKDNYQQLLNQEISGFYLNNQTVKSTALTIVGITNEITPLDTIYISQLANLKQIKEIYQNDDIALQLAMINLDVKADAKTLIKEFKQEYPRLKFKIAGENISQKADQLINQVQAILFLFSLLAIVAACFLIGEVLYLSVVEKTKDIGIFKCLGASKLQIMILVLLESFIIITFGYLGAYLILKQIINLINEFVVKGLSLSLTTSFIEIDYFLLILIYLISLFLGLISSLFPAVYASKIDCVKALKYHQY